MWWQRLFCVNPPFRKVTTGSTEYFCECLPKRCNLAFARTCQNLLRQYLAICCTELIKKKENKVILNMNELTHILQSHNRVN